MAAATRIALKGKKVLLLEQHNILGGFSTSFVRGRFEFEASLHEFCDMGSTENPGDLRKLLDELGVKVDWVPVGEAYRLIIPESKIDVTMPFGVENYLNAIEKYIPGSRPYVSKFFQIAQEVLDALSYITASKGNPDKKVMLNRYPNFVKTAAYPLDDVLNALKMPEKVKNVITAYWCYLGIPTSRLNFTIFAAMMIKYITLGAYIPRYRSTEMALAFEKRFRELGGVIECNTRVDKILVEEGHVVGVETSRGEHIKTEQVLCSTSPTKVYNEMIWPPSAVPQIAFQNVNARSHSSSAFVVFLGLDAPKEALGLRDYSYFIYDKADTKKLYQNFGQLDTPFGQATICLNRAIPDCSPPGTTIMSITTLTKPEAWLTIKPEDYTKKKQEFAQKLIDQFEKSTGIKIHDHIEELEIAGPVTYARYSNAYQGIIYGYEIDSWDSIIPRSKMMKEDQYIKGLRFSSGWGMRALGYSSAISCGNLEGLLALAEIMQKESVTQ
jgi:phytoene dehydrogenase-like protein